MNNYAELRAAVDDGSFDLDQIAYINDVRALLAERDAFLDQHHRDSKELRRLCAQRDAARKVSKEAGAVIAALKAERDALREALDELANGYAGSGWDIGLRQRLQKARAALAQEQGESMTTKTDGGAAFPVADHPSLSIDPGMTLRDYFAAKALPMCMTADESAKTVAEMAYSMADAMLKAREEE